MDKDAQTVVELPQDVVGVSAHDDAALAVCQLPDCPDLSVPEFVAQGAGIKVEQALGKSHIVGDFFIPLAHLFRGELHGFRGGAQNEVAVYIFNAEFAGDPAADFAAASAELPADGDDAFHNMVSSLCWGFLLHFGMAIGVTTIVSDF